MMLNYQQGQWQPLAIDQRALAYLRAVDVQDGTIVAAGGNGTIVSVAQ